MRRTCSSCVGPAPSLRIGKSAPPAPPLRSAPRPPPGMHWKGRDLRGGLDRRSEEVAKAVGGGYCRLQMPLKPALAVRGTVAENRLGTLDGGLPPPPPFQFISPPPPPPHAPLSGLLGMCRQSNV